MKVLSDKELRDSGVSEDLIDLRNQFKKRISDGYYIYDGKIIDRVFISNPHGYYKVFIRSNIGEIFEHGISPELLSKGVKI